MLQFITPYCSYRDDREYHRKTDEIIVWKTWVDVVEFGSYKFEKPQ